MAISRMQQPRQMYQEGGIMPRLNQLGSGVSSAEQMLEGINQRLESAESSLGEGGGLSTGVQTPDPFFGKGELKPIQLAGGNATTQQPFNLSHVINPIRPGAQGSTMSSMYSNNYIGDRGSEQSSPIGQLMGFGAVGDPRLGAPDVPNSLQQVMRGARANGGMMGRQMYGLGSFVKSIGKGVKSAVSGVKDFVKSDAGKALGIAALGYGLGGGKLFGGTGFNFRNIPGMTTLFGTGGPEMLSSYKPGLLKKGIAALNLGVPEGKKPTFSQFATVFGLGSLGGAALQALEASGAEEEDITDIDALRSYLRQGYRQLNPEASDADIDAFVEQNTVEYRANGGRIGYADGMNDPKTLPKGLTMDTTTKNPIPENALPKEIEMISKIMMGPGRSGIGEPEDGTMKGYQFFRDQYLPKKVKELSENFGYSEDEIYKMINTRVREYMGNPGKPLMAEGGRMKYAMGDSAEQNAMQASGIMGLPLNQNPAGITELDLRETGGFIPPVGVKEKADDIPAMLSNNEFVFTADAVRGMGGGDVEKGAQRLYDQMKMLEEGGRVA